jgi:hypothetical protein
MLHDWWTSQPFLFPKSIRFDSLPSLLGVPNFHIIEATHSKVQTHNCAMEIGILPPALREGDMIAFLSPSLHLNEVFPKPLA